MSLLEGNSQQQTTESENSTATTTNISTNNRDESCTIRQEDNDGSFSESNQEESNLSTEADNYTPSPLIPKELVFDSKLVQYISEYRDEIKMKSRDDLLECEGKSLEVLMNDQGFQFVTRKMLGKEHLEEAFFIEFLEEYCSGR